MVRPGLRHGGTASHHARRKRVGHVDLRQGTRLVCAQAIVRNVSAWFVGAVCMHKFVCCVTVHVNGCCYLAQANWCCDPVQLGGYYTHAQICG